MKFSTFGLTSSVLFALVMSFGMGKAQSFQISSGVDRAGFIEKTGIDDFVPPSSPEIDYETVVNGAGLVSGAQGCQRLTFMETAETSDGQYTLAEVSQLPQSGPPLHSHNRETEWWYIPEETEGKLSFQIDNQSFTASPGDLVRSDPGEVHRWTNTGTTREEFYLVTKPSGFEEFFRETSVKALSSLPTPDDLQISAALSEAGLELAPNNTTAVPEPSVHWAR
jgi:quercetin dioxygenase-like cupin family protein